MALPTTTLTLHCDVSDSASVYENINAGGAGSHTGNNPAAGTAIEFWNDQGDGIADVGLSTAVEDTADPLYRAAGTMKLAALDFDGTNDRFVITNQANSANKTAGDLIDATDFTLAFVFYPESITATDASAYNNQCLISGNDYWGIAVRDNGSGTKQCEAWIYDGSAKTARVTIAVNRTWIAVMRYDGTNISLRVTDDTGSVLTDSIASGNPTNLEGMTVGGGNTAFFNGHIGEFAIYDSNLTGTNLSDLETYFTDKWLTLSSPVNISPGVGSTPMTGRTPTIGWSIGMPDVP